MRNDSNAGPQQGADRRRSKRVYVQIRVRVEGYLKEKTPFAEETETFAVNAHGALVGLNAEPHLGQNVDVRNAATNETQQSKVVFVIMAKEESSSLGSTLPHRTLLSGTCLSLQKTGQPLTPMPK